ncbi:MAG: diguanylate cyclase [Firmicutes bacterium]|jgi:diguanylate cyclase (GGDEF)-like protein|nr:diguanylate cyclase [Bacillota bacterium]
MKKQGLYRKHINTINRKFNLLVGVFMVCIMVFFFLFSTYIENKSYQEELATKADNTITLMKESFSVPIWNYDLQTINSIGHSLLEDDEIVGLKITEFDIEALLYEDYKEDDGYEKVVKKEDIIYKDEIIAEIEISLTTKLAKIHMKDYIRNSMIFVLFIFLAIVIVLRIIARYITKPIIELSAVSKRIASGELFLRANIDSNDEISELGKEFNSMADNLVSKIDEARYLSSHDKLTGLYNRLKLEENYSKLREEQYPIALLICDINGLKLANEIYGHEFGDHVIKTLSQILLSFRTKERSVYRWGGDEFILGVQNCGYNEIGKLKERLEDRCKEEKFDKAGYPILNVTFGYSIMESSDVLLNDAIREATELMSRKKLLESRSIHSSIIEYLKSTLSERSKETYEHAERLFELSELIANELELSEDEMNQLKLFSSLHDLGKIAIRDSILLKPGPLSDEEWVEMKKHSEIGYRLALSSPELAIIAELILCHHERWDGKGYPQNLEGEAIPLLARILSIADAYDAMTVDRVYRKKLTKEDAIEEIKRGLGSQFDPKIGKIFIDKVKHIEI